jgi:lipopolysaccharide export system protein LptC
MKDARTLLRDAWEYFLLYLPLVCLGALALTTYWMVRTTPGAEFPSAAMTPRGHTPDYFMEGFAIKTYDANGQLHSEVRGDRARHFPDAEWLEIDAIRIRTVDDHGVVTTATANRGLTNDDGSQVQLLGNALVIRNAANKDAKDGKPTEDRTEYRSEFLHAFLTSEKLRSDQPVDIVHGANRFSANQLNYDNVEQTMELTGKVRVTLVPNLRNPSNGAKAP